MKNVFLGKVTDIDLIAKIVTTDKGNRAIMPDNVRIGSLIGMNERRETYIMDESEASLYDEEYKHPTKEKSAERVELEAKASALGISFQANIKDETLRRKIEDAISAQSSSLEMNQ